MNIPQIKAALRNAIELAEKAPCETYFVGPHAETMHSAITTNPLACKALLVAIEGLEKLLRNSTPGTQSENIPRQALKEIESTWTL
jgi:hypothetical protein